VDCVYDSCSPLGLLRQVARQIESDSQPSGSTICVTAGLDAAALLNIDLINEKDRVAGLECLQDIKQGLDRSCHLHAKRNAPEPSLVDSGHRLHALQRAAFFENQGLNLVLKVRCR
jgi:hypothetical protein